jgi:hypothetical protein
LSGKQPNSVVLFLDRTHGKRLMRLLSAVKLNVMWHSRFFDKEELDTVWIAHCAKEQWVIISGDKSIEEVPEERQAVIDGRCKVFFFKDSNSLTEEWAAAVIVGRQRIFDIIEKNNGPFFVTIDKHARSHVSGVRFVGDGGPKSFDEQPQPVAATVSTATPKPKEKPKTPAEQDLFEH